MKTNLCTAIFFTVLLGSAHATALEIAVIVNQSNSTDELSSRSLEKIFKLRSRHWGNGSKIHLVLPEEGSAVKSLLLETVYEMSATKLKKFWLSKLYRGEISSFPQTRASLEATHRFINKAPNAIGVVDSSYVPDDVKVLAIDGRLPGEAGYPLSDGAPAVPKPDKPPSVGTTETDCTPGGDGCP